MYKKIVIFCLIFFIIICIVINSNKESAQAVFNSQDNNYDIFILDISKENITTNNIYNYFNDIKILEIYPYINPIYQKYLDIKSYSFNTVLSNKKNISNFITEYNKELNNNGLNNEMIKININGIKIDKIKVYTSNKDINNLINNYYFKIDK